MKVTGGAGTGKTVAALHRAKYLSKYGDGRILFTTFTKSLTNVLERDLRDLGANMSNIRITNLDKLVIQLVRQFRLITGRIGILEFSNKLEMIEGMLENLLFEVGLLEQYSSKDLLAEYNDVYLANNCLTLKEYQNVLRSGRGFRLGSNQRKEIWEVLQKYEQQLSHKGYVHLGRLYNDVSNYLNNHPDQKPFRHIVADEIQDLGLIKLRFLRALAPEAEDDLFLVGDPLQKIYPGTTTFSKVRIHIRGKRSRKLKINYRTTEQIRLFALLPVLPLDLEDFDGEAADKRAYISLRSGEQPEYQLYDTPEKELEQVTEQIQHYLESEETKQIAPSEIAIACPRNRQLDELVKHFHQLKIPYYKFSGSKSKGDRNGIVLSTMHNLKGHEYKVVFLLHIDAEHYPTRPTGYQSWTQEELEAHDRHQAALLYVASSRAITRLHVSGVGEACTFISSIIDQ
jgi:superfamily I DNA/RNA helicase